VARQLITLESVMRDEAESEVHAWFLEDPRLEWDGRSPLGLDFDAVVAAALAAAGQGAESIRRLELEEDDERYFWRAEVLLDDGEDLTVVLDLAGRAAEREVTCFDDDEAADEFADGLLEERDG